MSKCERQKCVFVDIKSTSLKEGHLFSFEKDVQSAHYMPSAVLGTEDRVMKRV